MSTRGSYPAGVPCWVAVLGPDPEALRRFYAALFGWTFTDVATAGNPPFYLAASHGHRVASVAGPEEHGTWITAVAVDDLDRAVEAACRSGGSAPGPVADIATLGRFHRLYDPAGAEIHVGELIDGRAAERVNEPGTWSMSSLGRARSADETAAVLDFYGAVFGWQVEQAGGVRLFRLPGFVGGEPEQPVPRDVVAVLDDSAEPASWTPDFWVENADAAAETAWSGGGKVIGEPTDTEVGFRTALLADPGGARFTVSQRR